MPVDLIALAQQSSYFVDRTSGIMQRVDSLDESFVHLTVMTALQSSYAMPTPTYDATWAKRFVPVSVGAIKPSPTYRPPADVSAWQPAEEIAPPDARGETPDGVRIGEGIA
jgi:hypothetical protein